jgi:geranylgeranyl diphosphate synthase, type I
LNSEQKSRFLAFADEVRPRVERRLHRNLARELQAIKRFGPEVVSACSALSEVCLRGGKRIRAALVFAGASCCRGRVNESLLVEIGSVVELLHAYFLVHDDWMDGDLVRRGGPSAHAILRDCYGQAAGDSAAILAGDWGATVANHWMAQLDLPLATATHLRRAYYDMQRAAIYGQLRDTLIKGDNIELTYVLKTASYTVEGPLVLGAIVGGATPATLSALKKFAIPLGIAFQLRDDLIGLFSDEAATGKPFGSDLKAGKYTSAARYALDRARGADKRLIKSVFGNPRATKRQLRDAVNLIGALGARAEVERRILQLVRLAARRLQAAPIADEGRELLASASSALALRST